MARNTNQVTLLSSSVSVPQYIALENSRDAEAILKFIKERFDERYIAPFRNHKEKHGFIMMVSACLMIESLESFHKGWKKSPNSALAFCQFFDRTTRFSALRGLSGEFYEHVRCGLMHQGETTGGWRIRRDSRELFDVASLTINATKFLDQVGLALDDYCEELRSNQWNSEIWVRFRKKMKAICLNTDR